MYKFTILFFTILFFRISNCEAQKPKELLFYDIPTTSIDLYKSINIDDTSFFRSVNAFQISEFITLIEYKAFLSDTKKDSSILYYETLLSDKSK